MPETHLSRFIGIKKVSFKRQLDFVKVRENDKYGRHAASGEICKEYPPDPVFAYLGCNLSNLKLELEIFYWPC